jgi:hypothetical protein
VCVMYVVVLVFVLIFNQVFGSTYEQYRENHICEFYLRILQIGRFRGRGSEGSEVTADIRLRNPKLSRPLLTQILTSLLKAEESLSPISLFLHIILLLLSTASRILKILRVDSGPQISESPWLSSPGLSLWVSLCVSFWVSNLLLSLRALARDA